jgi:pimeloyl-ACP methyl ester carboxylesterase
MTPLIFVHGSGHTHESFAAQTTAFPSSDAVSLPGHPEGTALTSVGDCAVWLAKYLHWKGDGRAIVAGNSLGGAIAIEWALRYPADVAGLVLLGAGARLRVSAEIFALIDDGWPACIDTLVDLSLAPSAPESLRDRVAGWHREVGQATTRQDFADCNAFDVMERIGTVAAPTLIVVGSEDRLTPVKYSQFLHAKIGGSKLAIVEGAGHLAHLELPGAVNLLIEREFGDALR